MKVLRNLLFTISLIVFSYGYLSAFDELRTIDQSKSKITDIDIKFNNSSDIQIDSNSILQDYMRYALMHNPDVKSAFYRWKSELEKTGYVGALPDPIIMYGYFVENVETRVGPQQQKFSVKQQFPWFGTLHNKKSIAFESSQVSYKLFQSQLLETMYQVKSAYFDLYLLGREIEITKENFALLQLWESVELKKYVTSTTKHADLIKLQIELGLLEDKILSLEEQVRPSKIKLANILHLPSSHNIAIPTILEIDESIIDKDKTIAQVLVNNPNLNAYKHLIEREHQALQLANKSSLPNFTLGVDYIETGEANNLNTPESGKDAWIASIGLQVPLWFGKNSAKKNEAKAKIKSAQYTKQAKEDNLISLTEKILSQYDDALRKLQLYRDGLIPKAEQSLHVSYKSYQSGDSDFLNLLDAQKQYLQFQIMFERSKTNTAKRKAEINMLTGYNLQNPNL